MGTGIQHGQGGGSMEAAVGLQVTGSHDYCQNIEAVTTQKEQKFAEIAKVHSYRYSNSVSVVHGKNGCAHYNRIFFIVNEPTASLLHAPYSWRSL